MTGVLEKERLPSIDEANALFAEHPDLVKLNAYDFEVLDELRTGVENHEFTYSKSVGEWYPNKEIGERVQATYTAQEMRQLEAFLRAKGTLTVPLLWRTIRLADGTEQEIPLVTATDPETHHGEMSAYWWVRDHVKYTRSLMERWLHDPANYGEEERKLAKALLFGALHLLTTPRQQERSDGMIRDGEDISQVDCLNIVLDLNDLGAEQTLFWRHRQDALAMLTDLSFDALTRRFITPDELAPAHKQLLGNIVPILHRMGFPENEENSGSWEEGAVRRRTSVTAIETAMLYQLYTLMQSDLGPQLGFLRTGFDAHMNPDGKADFIGTVSRMTQEGLRVVGRQLPFESPEEDPNSIWYREADATLTYVLLYDLPRLLAEHQIPIGKEQRIMTERQIEDLVLNEIFKLYDPETGGIRRYAGDPYQRVNFLLPSIIKRNNRMKQAFARWARITGRPIDLAEKQRRRDALVPKGPEAAWAHTMAEVADWSVHRALRAQRANSWDEADHYLDGSIWCTNQVLRMVTGEGEVCVALNEKGDSVVRKVKPFSIPESRNYYRDKRGEFPAPAAHHPLYWGVGATACAINLQCVALEAREARRKDRIRGGLIHNRRSGRLRFMLI
ncbi:MAG TPA: hypothetical protein VLF69_01155 [Candidatus Saccharimonadales bacterium]|nr:hypothetical protein [Candidatus Saccharimonadales bacterium]